MHIVIKEENTRPDLQAMKICYETFSERTMIEDKVFCEQNAKHYFVDYGPV